MYDTHVSIVCDRERERQNHDLSNELQKGVLSELAIAMYLDAAFQYPPDLLEVFWEETKDTLLRSGKTPTELDGLRPKILSHALLDSANAGDPVLIGREVRFIHPSFRDYFVAVQCRAALEARTLAPTLQECLRRPISSDLAALFASQVSGLSEHLSTMVRQGQHGLANCLLVLMDGIREGAFEPEFAESALAAALGGKAVRNAGLENMRLERLVFRGWDFSGCNLSGVQLAGC